MKKFKIFLLFFGLMIITPNVYAEELKTGTYKHSGYSEFFVTEPKLRRIEKSKYIDRIVHRWYVDNFMKEYFMKSFINII